VVKTKGICVIIKARMTIAYIKAIHMNLLLRFFCIVVYGSFHNLSIAHGKSQPAA